MTREYNGLEALAKFLSKLQIKVGVNHCTHSSPQEGITWFQLVLSEPSADFLCISRQQEVCITYGAGDGMWDLPAGELPCSLTAGGTSSFGVPAQVSGVTWRAWGIDT